MGISEMSMEEEYKEQQKRDFANRKAWMIDHFYEGAIMERGHRIMGDRSRRLYSRLGVVVVALTTVVGTSAFANLAEWGQSKVLVTVAVGLLSVLSAVLAALQTFLQYNDDAKGHVVIAGDIAKVISLYRYLLTLPDEKVEDDRLYDLNNEFSELMKKDPPVPLDVKDAARRELEREWGGKLLQLDGLWVSKP